MVETLEEGKREGKKDIPPIAARKEVIYAAEWKDKFGYPINQIKAADYFVKYNYNAKQFGSVWLIEGAITNLHYQIKQLEESAEFFKKKKIQIDTYLVVLDNPSKRDKQKYKFKETTLKPLKQVYERLDYDTEKPYLIQKKPLFYLKRSEKNKFLK